MNPTDEELLDEMIDKVVEVTPIERVVRHADTNDNYREPVDAEDTNNGSEVEVTSLPASSVFENQHETEGENDLVPLESVESIATIAKETSTDTSNTVNEKSYAQIQAEQEMKNITSSQEVVDVLQFRDVSQVETLPPLSEVAEFSSPNTLTTSPGTAYHTVLGGPETLNDIMTHEQALHPKPIPQNTQNDNPYISSTFGYTIPNAEYAASPVITVEEQNNFWVGFSLFVMVAIGGAVTYIFFFMPQVFEQASQAAFIVKDQLFGK